MRLSTSSSNDRLPKGNWIYLWVGTFLFFFTFLLLTEVHLRWLGWRPSAADSVDLWITQRKLASAYGKNAIILVGASRIQLGLDLDRIKWQTNMQPVQLAIDGTAYLPVLEDLARDPSIVGTIIVSINADSIRRGTPNDRSTQWVKQYKNIQNQSAEPYRIFHTQVASLLNRTLVTRLEGAKPATVLAHLAFSGSSFGNYLITYPTRSREADYAKVKMPQFYAARVQRHFGDKPIISGAVTFKQFIDSYKKEIGRIGPNKIEPFEKNLNDLMRIVRKIEQRGGNVIFVRFPTDKLVWEIDKERYPKKLFWQRINSKHFKSIHFADYPSLSSFSLPDGSHLDMRDKKEFTDNLFRLLIQKGWINSKNG